MDLSQPYITKCGQGTTRRMGSRFFNWHSFRVRLCKRGQLIDVSSFPFLFCFAQFTSSTPLFLHHGNYTTADANTTATTTVTTTTATTNSQPPKDTPTSQNDEFERKSFRRYCGNPEGLWRRLEEAIHGYTSKSLLP